VHQQGLANLEEVVAAILGTDGSATVVPRTGLGRVSVLSDVASQRSGQVRS
jgi:uncharacterized membrane protein YcaP (DUF421 family)